MPIKPLTIDQLRELAKTGSKAWVHNLINRALHNLSLTITKRGVAAKLYSDKDLWYCESDYGEEWLAYDCRPVCNNCEYYYKEHCANGTSPYCTETVDQNCYCFCWEPKGGK